eukprot:5237968-Prymnesium_polylepis.1
MPFRWVVSRWAVTYNVSVPAFRCTFDAARQGGGHGRTGTKHKVAAEKREVTKELFVSSPAENMSSGARECRRRPVVDPAIDERIVDLLRVAIKGFPPGLRVH